MVLIIAVHDNLTEKDTTAQSPHNMHDGRKIAHSDVDDPLSGLSTLISDIKSLDRSREYKLPIFLWELVKGGERGAGWLL